MKRSLLLSIPILIIKTAIAGVHVERLSSAESLLEEEVDCSGQSRHFRERPPRATLVNETSSYLAPIKDDNDSILEDMRRLEGFNRLFESNRQEIFPPVAVHNQEGSVPDWLNGVFLRNGPGSWDTKEGGRELQGWIDGFAKMEQWKIEKGQVQFGTKFLRSSFYNRSQAQDDVAFSFGIVGKVSPPFEKKGLIQSVASITDNSQINVWPFSNETLALTGDFQLRDFKVDPDTLEMDTFRFQGRPKVFGGRTSHPQHAVGRSDVSYSVTVPFMEVPGKGYHMCLNEISSSPASSLQRNEVACHWIPRLTNFHTVAITQNYALLYDSPLSAEVDMLQVLRGNIKVDMGWDPQGKTRAMIASLDKGKQHRFREVELPTSAYCGHVVNSWEEATDDPNEIEIVSDWECSDGKRITWLLSGCAPHRFCSHPAEGSDFAPALWRFRYRLRETDDSFEIIYGGVERKYQLHFPEQSDESFYSLLMSNNYDYRGQPYCYVYSFGFHENKSEWFLVKTNLCSSGNAVDNSGHIPALSERWFEPGHVPSEPTFVARPGATEEDDGIVLSTVHDTLSNRTYLAVFDAQTMTLVSKSYAPMQSIFGLHGRFFDFGRQRSY